MITLSTGPKEKVRRLVFEIPIYKVMVVHDGDLLAEPMIRTPEDAARVVQKHLQGADREHARGRGRHDRPTCHGGTRRPRSLVWRWRATIESQPQLRGHTMVS